MQNSDRTLIRMLWAFFAATLTTAPAIGQTTELISQPEYVMHRTDGPMQIDGRLDESAWLAAPVMGPFHFPWYKEGRKEQSVAKMLWDHEYVYIAHISEDAHIAARTEEHDGPESKDDCFGVLRFSPKIIPSGSPSRAAR